MIPSLAEAREWARALKDFDGLFSSVIANVGALMGMTSARVAAWPADLQADRVRLMNVGIGVRNKLQALKDTRDRVLGWLRALLPSTSSSSSTSVSVTKGPSGRRGPATVRGLGDLGVLPVIPIAVGLAAFIAALAAAKSWLAEAASLAKRVEVFESERERLRAEGVPPEEASRRASDTAGRVAGEANAPGILERLGGKALWIGAGVLLIVFGLPAILEEHRRARGR